jgi:hypothetical protein
MPPDEAPKERAIFPPKWWKRPLAKSWFDWCLVLIFIEVLLFGILLFIWHGWAILVSILIVIIVMMVIGMKYSPPPGAFDGF